MNYVYRIDLYVYNHEYTESISISSNKIGQLYSFSWNVV